jgi:hypothetical protein
MRASWRKNFPPSNLCSALLTKRVVPFVNAHADVDVDITEVERANGTKKSPGGPFFLRYPVGLREPPCAPHHVLFWAVHHPVSHPGLAAVIPII